MVEQTWKDVVGVEGYQVSSDGLLRRVGNRKQRLLKECYNRSKRPYYQFESLGQHFSVLTEYLVAQHFVPNPNKFPCVYHKDGNIYNNKAGNLYWGDTLEEIKIYEGEIWKDVVGYEGLYKVSNKGRVVSLARFVINKIVRGRLLSTVNNGHGYEMVGLSKDGVSKGKLVHRLVAQAFIPNPENKPYIDHIDTNKLNNCVENLRWCTSEENMQNKTTKKKMRSHGGENSKNAVPLLRVSLSDGSIKAYSLTTQAIKENQISHDILKECLNGKRFSHKGFRYFYLHNFNIREEEINE